MKATVGTLLMGLAAAQAAIGQTPNAAPVMAPIPAPVYLLPQNAPSARYSPPLVGAQFPGASVPAPPMPTLPVPPSVSGQGPWTGPMPVPAMPGPAPMPSRSNGSAFEAPTTQLSTPMLPVVPTDTPPVTSDGPSFGLTNNAAPSGPSLWLNADYLLWWTKRGPQPDPLVVTGSQADPFPGALDQPNTTVLFGGRGLNYNVFSGVRLSAGIWGGPDQRWGFEASGFRLEQKSVSFNAAGDANGSPFIGRPFVNAQTGNENVYFVSQNFADPNSTAMMTGGIHINSGSSLWSYETNGLWNFYRDESKAVNLIGGFRSLGLRERLRINENLRNLPPGGALTFAGTPVDPTGSVSTFDKFDAENTFYGGQLGTRVHFERNRFSLDLTGKAALGVTQQLVVVDGGSFLRDATGGVVAAMPGGILAQTTNMGRHYQNKFAVVPEGNADFSYALTERLVLRAGYTFVYWSSVLRPGNQIDRTINPGVVPTDAGVGSAGPASPAFPYRTSSYWAQGANFGFEFRY